MSAMSELATELDTATRCATIGCKGAPTALLVWTDGLTGGLSGELARATVGDRDAVCSQCGASYRRRPWVMARATLLPGPNFTAED